MSPIKINVGGKSSASSTRRSARTGKPSTVGTAKRTTKPAKKASTAKKSTAKGGRGPAKGSGGAPRGPRTPKVEPKLLEKHVKALEAAGKRRADAEAEHDASVTNVHEVAQAALAAEIPMTLISDKLGISRQWLYKMGNFRSRTNGSKPKAAAKKATSAARTTRSTAKKSTSKPAAKKPAGKKPRVRIGG